MKLRSIFLVLGISLFTTACSSSKTVVLKEDFDLGKNYCFEGAAPVTGILKAGTKVEIKMLKGGAAYINIPAVVNRQELEKHSTLTR